MHEGSFHLFRQRFIYFIGFSSLQNSPSAASNDDNTSSKCKCYIIIVLQHEKATLLYLRLCDGENKNTSALSMHI